MKLSRHVGISYVAVCNDHLQPLKLVKLAGPCSTTMTMTVQDHQYMSVLSRQIKELLYVSLLLSAVIATLSFVNLGRLSVFMAPVAFFLTAIHHATILRLLRREPIDETKTESTKKVTLAPTSYKAGIFACWVLIVLWVVVVLSVVIISVMVVTAERYETWERLAGYFEIPLEVAEIALLVVLAFKCRKQRRKTLANMPEDKQDHASTV